MVVERLHNGVSQGGVRKKRGHMTLSASRGGRLGTPLLFLAPSDLTTLDVICHLVSFSAHEAQFIKLDKSDVYVRYIHHPLVTCACKD